jgi:hypothetical protein
MLSRAITGEWFRSNVDFEVWRFQPIGVTNALQQGATLSLQHVHMQYSIHVQA